MGCWTNVRKRHLSVVPMFWVLRRMRGVWDIVCVMWCTSDVSFIFIVGWVFGYRGWGGETRKDVGKRRVTREWTKN